MEVEKVIFPIFQFFGYEKMESVKNKSQKEIVFILFTMGLVILRTALSIMGLKSGDVDAMCWSVFLNIIPVLQALLVLSRKNFELERKNEKSFNGVFKKTNTVKKMSPYVKRIITMCLWLGTTVVFALVYFCNFSSEEVVKVAGLEAFVIIYMVASTADGILEQLIALCEVEV